MNTNYSDRIDNVTSLFAHLYEAGVSLSMLADKIKAEPGRRLTPQLRQGIRQHRTAVVRILKLREEKLQ